MTSSKKAMSLLTAAALIVAPMGGVTALYETGYADDGDDGHEKEDSVPVPTSVDEAAQWIQNGKIASEASLDKALGSHYISETDHQTLCAQLKEKLSADAKAAEEAEAAAKAEAEKQAAAEKAEAEKKAADEKKAAEEAAQKEAAAGEATKSSKESDTSTTQPAHAKKQVNYGVVGGDAADDTASPSGKTPAEGNGSANTAAPTANGFIAQSSDDTITEPGDDADTKGDASAGDAPVTPDGSTAGDTTAQPPAAASITLSEYAGITVEEARAALEELGLTVQVVEEHSDTVPAGTVIGMNPSAGTEVQQGDAITLTVSLGAAEQPANPADPTPAPEPTPTPEKPADTSNPVDDGIQKPNVNGATPVTKATHTAAIAKGKAQTPLKQAAAMVPSISFTHLDNSSYVARHYSEDLTTEKFISLIGESARSIAAENDLYASVMIAQAILESASGNSKLAQAPNNNLFGIKGAYKGNSVQLPTMEDDGTGSHYSIMSDFRQYANIDESLADYADLLSNSMGDFYAGAHKSNTESFVDATDFLVGRYATDVFYSEKLQDLIETYDLTRFDVPLTYELQDVFVIPAVDEETGKEVMLDPVEDKEEYDALVAEYEAYLAGSEEYQRELAEWEEQTRVAQEMYNVPIYLEKPVAPKAETPMEQHQSDINAQRFEGFDELIEQGKPLPVREVRTLNDLTTMATSFLGVPYVWGGNTPEGFDCSGLVQYCYREVFNIELPRTTYYQCDVGVEVGFEELLPGDLLFFDDGGDVHHVAMYLGDGYYVEAPHTGDVVKITAMNDKLPDFAKRVVDVRDIDLSEFSDEQLTQFVEREKYLQEREERLGVTDEALEELTEWLQGLEF